MAQLLGFGNGSDGVLTVSSSTTFAQTDATCSGSSGSSTLTATASFTAGDIVFIYQTRGTGVGKWEIGQVSSYTTGTITLTFPLVNTYIDSGSSQAQVIKMPQYSGVNILSTLTAKAWDGNVGGVIPFLCNGTFNLTGIINCNGSNGGTATGTDGATTTGGGFYGGRSGAGSMTEQGGTGEGSAGPILYQYQANGSGGGGGKQNNTTGHLDGGGGGNGTVGTKGADGDENLTNRWNGLGGSTSGNDSLSLLSLGGGGGGGTIDNNNLAGSGGSGAASCLIFARNINISSGQINLKGGNGGTSDGGAGGGGAGGSILIKGQTVNIGTNKISTIGGSGGAVAGGTGGKGRVRIEACSLTGSLSSTYYGTYSTSTGGHSYCGGSAFIF